MTESAIGTHGWHPDCSPEFSMGPGADLYVKLAARWALTFLGMPLERIYWYRSHDRQDTFFEPALGEHCDPYLHDESQGLFAPDGESGSYVAKPAFEMFSHLLPRVDDANPSGVGEPVVDGADPHEEAEVQALTNQAGETSLAVWLRDTRRYAKPDWACRDADWMASGMEATRHLSLRVEGLDQRFTTATAISLQDGSTQAIEGVQSAPVDGAFCVQLVTPPLGDLPLLIQLGR